MKQNILKLTTAAFVGLFATSAHATAEFTQEEWEAFINLKPSLVKKIAHEVEDAGGSDAFEQIMGVGGLDVIKARIGVGGNTGADVDLDAQIDRIEGGNPTLKDALDHAKLALGVGGVTTIVNDIPVALAAAGAAGVPVGTLHKVTGATTGLTLDGDLDAQIARIDATPALSIDAATTGVIAVLTPGSGAGLLADVNAEIAAANLASGGADADLHAAIGTLAGAVPVVGTLHKVTAATTAVSLSGDLDAQILRVENPAPVPNDIDTAVGHVKAVLNPASNAGFLADVNAEIAAANLASGGADADLHAAIGTLAGAVPVVGTLHKVTGATTAVSLSGDLDAQLARLDNPAPADITTGLTSAEALIVTPYANTLVQNLTTFRANLIVLLNAEKAAGRIVDLANPVGLTLDGGADVDPAAPANTLNALLTYIGTKQING